MWRSLLQRIDEAQRRRRFVALPAAVLRKYGDDGAPGRPGCGERRATLDGGPLERPRGPAATAAVADAAVDRAVGAPGAGAAATAAASGFAALGRGLPVTVGALCFTLLVHFALYDVAFRLLTPLQLSARDVAPGAAFGAGAWTVLLLAGTYLVGHQIGRMSDVYGSFALVLGLLWWLYLAAQIVMRRTDEHIAVRFDQDGSDEPSSSSGGSTVSSDCRRSAPSRSRMR